MAKGEKRQAYTPSADLQSNHFAPKTNHFVPVPDSRPIRGACARFAIRLFRMNRMRPSLKSQIRMLEGTLAEPASKIECGYGSPASDEFSFFFGE